MIYDKLITILKLPDDVGSPMRGKLQPVFTSFCGEMTVFHARFWNSVQAGSRIDVMVELPLYRKNVEAEYYASYEGHIHRIEQVQYQTDGNQLPVTVLSMKREEKRYDIAGI